MEFEDHWLDEDGLYPSESGLKAIEDFGNKLKKDGNPVSVREMFEFLSPFVQYDALTLLGDNILYFFCQGWSGNEDIIEALSDTWFWKFRFHSNMRGGSYIFSQEGPAFWNECLWCLFKNSVKQGNL